MFRLEGSQTMYTSLRNNDKAVNVVGGVPEEVAGHLSKYTRIRSFGETPFNKFLPNDPSSLIEIDLHEYGT